MKFVVSGGQIRKLLRSVGIITIVGFNRHAKEITGTLSSNFFFFEKELSSNFILKRIYIYFLEVKKIGNPTMNKDADKISIAPMHILSFFFSLEL